MSIEQSLLARAGNKCELCGSEQDVAAVLVSPHSHLTVDTGIVLCGVCQPQVAGADANHWRCLNDSMWSQVPAVQVVSYRMLKRLGAAGEAWAQDQLDVMYMEEDTRKWAETRTAEEDREPTRDSNGAILQAGDSVTLIKDLDVKGANFTAKRGTMVRGISLTDNPEHIEGRVNGVRIVIISAYTKKA